MVDFLTLNDWPMPVLDASFTEAFEYGGARGRRYSGILRQQRRWRARRAEFDTPIMTPELSKAVIGLFQGRGNRWDYAYGHFSDKGYGPESGHTATISSGVLTIPSGTNYVLTDILDEPGWDGHYTVIASYSSTTTSTVQRLLWRDSDAAGAGYSDGVAVTGHGIDNIHSFSSVTGLTLKGVDLGGGNEATLWRNVVVLPYRVTDSMAAVFSDPTNAFSALPSFRIVFNSEEVEYAAVGEVTDVSYVQGSDAGTWKQDLQRATLAIETSSVRGTSTVPTRAFDSGFDSGFL